MMKSSAQMLIESGEPAQRRVGWLVVSWMRVMSLALFGMTIIIWLRAVGYWPGEEFRFDTMPVSHRILTAILAVLFPVASVGMWSTLSWGRVVWYMAVIVHLLGSYFANAAILPFSQLLALHGISLAIYLSLRFWMYSITKEE